MWFYCYFAIIFITIFIVIIIVNSLQLHQLISHCSVAAFRVVYNFTVSIKAAVFMTIGDVQFYMLCWARWCIGMFGAFRPEMNENEWMYLLKVQQKRCCFGFLLLAAWGFLTVGYLKRLLKCLFRWLNKCCHNSLISFR